ncbi:hypothetical protein CCR85_04410 [Rhodothalassium salexigens]|uniref:flagellin n=1 Tax=Rhodothalassium salexigens TaxID=1086 RepID=UPI00191155D0|nr:flagellin [Rhodothalassium salexigens]MBK5910734.1 hypothetical protein [Rhodothalassium salexigens]MBK5919816.1 hypothetical protein [Rhodothalassium salexigens]
MRITNDSDLLVQLALANRDRATESQLQVGSGKKAQDFKGLAEDTQTALSTRSLLSRNESLQGAVSRARVDLKATDTRLNTVYEIAQDLVQTLKNAVGQERGDGLEETLDKSFEQIVGILNGRQNDLYIFGGTRTDTPPVNVATRADLQATTTANAFDNFGPSREARVADNLTVELGVQADDVARNLFQVIENITNAGPFPDDKLSAAQIATLTTEVGNLETATRDVANAQTDNGLNLNRLNVASDQLEQEAIALERFKTEVEDVDPAEAINRLMNDKFALEASYRSINLLQQTTLLNFI